MPNHVFNILDRKSIEAVLKKNQLDHAKLPSIQQDIWQAIHTKRTLLNDEFLTLWSMSLQGDDTIKQKVAERENQPFSISALTSPWRQTLNGNTNVKAWFEAVRKSELSDEAVLLLENTLKEWPYPLPGGIPQDAIKQLFSEQQGGHEAELQSMLDSDATEDEPLSKDQICRESFSAYMQWLQRKNILEKELGRKSFGTIEPNRILLSMWDHMASLHELVAKVYRDIDSMNATLADDDKIIIYVDDEDDSDAESIYSDSGLDTTDGGSRAGSATPLSTPNMTRVDRRNVSLSPVTPAMHDATLPYTPDDLVMNGCKTAGKTILRTQPHFDDSPATVWSRASSTLPPSPLKFSPATSPHTPIKKMPLTQLNNTDHESPSSVWRRAAIQNSFKKPSQLQQVWTAETAQEPHVASKDSDAKEHPQEESKAPAPQKAHHGKERFFDPHTGYGAYGIGHLFKEIAQVSQDPGATIQWWMNLDDWRT